MGDDNDEKIELLDADDNPIQARNQETGELQFEDRPIYETTEEGVQVLDANDQPIQMRDPDTGDLMFESDPVWLYKTEEVTTEGFRYYIDETANVDNTGLDVMYDEYGVKVADSLLQKADPGYVNAEIGQVDYFYKTGDDTSVDMLMDRLVETGPGGVEYFMFWLFVTGALWWVLWRLISWRGLANAGNRQKWSVMTSVAGISACLVGSMVGGVKLTEYKFGVEDMPEPMIAGVAVAGTLAVCFAFMLYMSMNH